MKKNKKPWPTASAMAQIYECNLWGGKPSTFYSGEGSHNPNIVVPYIETVQFFLRSFQDPLVVCDLGCGDFNIGKALVPFSKHYVAVDIVPDLIDHLENTYTIKNLTFASMDIARDELPKADCAFLRQVLQHLSNYEIKAISTKLLQYKYVIVTEHIPEGSFVTNIDIVSGQGTRLKRKSGVDLSVSPFNLIYKSKKILLSLPCTQYNGILETTLYTMF